MIKQRRADTALKPKNICRAKYINMWLIIYFAIVAVSVAVDQITKIAAVKHLADINCIEVIPGALEFKYIENDGMAFGLLSGARWIFMSVSVIAILAMVVYLIKWRPASKFACIGISLIIGGGIGNMIDRLFFTSVLDPEQGGKVVRDFIYFCGFGDLWVWIFNVADACVCVGGAMLFIWCVIAMIKEYKLEKQKKNAKPEESEAAEAQDEKSE